MKSIVNVLIFIMLLNNVLHAMDERKINIIELVKYSVIPVLYVNDYIVPVSNCYEALSKELFLFIKAMDKKLTSFLTSQHNDNNKYDSAIPKYLPARSDIWQKHWQNHYDFLTEGDVESLEQLPNNICMCLGNIACGVGMVGILLILTFCK